MAKIYCSVSNAKNHKKIATHVEVANRFLSRLRGLLGRKSLPVSYGLLLWHCSSIHCFGMHFPIDVIFLDRHARVMSIRENMLPGARASQSQAHCVLELCAGEVKKHKIEVGDQLLISFNCS